MNRVQTTAITVCGVALAVFSTDLTYTSNYDMNNDFNTSFLSKCDCINLNQSFMSEATIPEYDRIWFSSSIDSPKRKQTEKEVTIEELLELSLKNKKYNWRTIEGLSKEIDVSKKTVEEALSQMVKNKIVFVVMKKNVEKIYKLID